MRQKDIDDFKNLAMGEDNPNVLSRALDKTLQDLEYVRTLARKALSGDEQAAAQLRIEVDS